MWYGIFPGGVGSDIFLVPSVELGSTPLSSLSISWFEDLYLTESELGVRFCVEKHSLKHTKKLVISLFLWVVFDNYVQSCIFA